MAPLNTILKENNIELISGGDATKTLRESINKIKQFNSPYRYYYKNNESILYAFFLKHNLKFSKDILDNSLLKMVEDNIMKESLWCIIDEWFFQPTLLEGMYDFHFNTDDPSLESFTLYLKANETGSLRILPQLGSKLDEIFQPDKHLRNMFSNEENHTNKFQIEKNLKSSLLTDELCETLYTAFMQEINNSKQSKGI